MALPLNWLRGFESTARPQDFARAADEPNISQAAIRQQVRPLEEHAGRKPPCRLRRTVSLTGSGRHPIVSVAGGLALLGRNLADDRKSSASPVEISRNARFR